MAKKKKTASVDTNAIGDQGESIFKTRITQYHIFNVFFLGDKAPIVDFLVEINDSKTPYAFMVQVKSTEKPLGTAKTLNVKVPTKKYKNLVERPLPTYIAGVDISNEAVYLCSAFADKTNLPSMPTKYCLKFSKKVTTKKVLDLLKQDVIKYWKGAKVNGYKKSFKSCL